MVDRDGLVFGGNGELSDELIAADGNEIFPVGCVGQGGGSRGVWGGGVSVWTVGGAWADVRAYRGTIRGWAVIAGEFPPSGGSIEGQTGGGRGGGSSSGGA